MEYFGFGLKKIGVDDILALMGPGATSGPHIGVTELKYLFGAHTTFDQGVMLYHCGEFHGNRTESQFLI